MWKMPQATPRTTPPIHPTMPAVARSHSSRKMISPAYMFPKRRSECDSGFEMYSTRLKTKLSGHRTGLEPNGEQKSSWMKPNRPFVFTAKKIIIAQTDRASAKVVDTSALGTIRNP